MRGLKGRVAIVTGAASGIGAATSRRLAEEGCRLVLADITEEAGEKLADELRTLDCECQFRHCDVSSQEQVESLIDYAVDFAGRLDCLVNNAGTGTYGKSHSLAVEEWHRVLAVNLNSVFYGCRSAIPHMRAAGGGSIVNTASVSGLFGDFGLTAYNASKAAVINYTRSLALDHGRDGIRANSVCPGPVLTGLTGIILNDEERRAGFDDVVPLGRIGEPSEIASAIAFLLSDDASYISGEALVVDGGLTVDTGQPSYTKLLKDDS